VRALILAAGSGERLRPLTEDRPKPMIEIGGKPILQYNVELLARAGVREAIVNLHHHGEVIRAYFGDGSAFGVSLSYVDEPELLGTAGAARNVAGYLSGDDFVLVYGDNLSTIDLGATIAQHRRTGADLTMALYHREDVGASGIVEIDERDRLTRFLEKPRPEEVFSHWVNAGYAVAKPWILGVIPGGRPSDVGRDLLPELLARGAKLYGYRMSEKLWWIDSPQDYERTLAAFA